MHFFCPSNSHKEPGKSLDLIQIEERAMQELLKLYNPSGNPNEKVTVERCPKNASPVTSPRNKGGGGGKRDGGKIGGKGKGRGKKKQVNPAQVSSVWDRRRIQ